VTSVQTSSQTCLVVHPFAIHAQTRRVAVESRSNWNFVAVEQEETGSREAVLEETQSDRYQSLVLIHQLDPDDPMRPDSALPVQASLAVWLHCMLVVVESHTRSGSSFGVEVAAVADWVSVSRQ
jgi:hypothetical protein